MVWCKISAKDEFKNKEEWKKWVTLSSLWNIKFNIWKNLINLFDTCIFSVKWEEQWSYILEKENKN